MEEVVIVEGLRTPIGKLGGALKGFPAYRLSALVIRGLLQRTGLDPQAVEQVIWGTVIPASDAPNLARVASLLAGLPKETTNYTVSQNCSSGLRTLANAWQNIQTGEADVQIVGAVESMSQAPYVSREMRFGKWLRHAQFIDSVWETLTDPLSGQLMGVTAENLVAEFGITREEQDRFALESHRKAARARATARLADELIPVELPRRSGGKDGPPPVCDGDEGPREDLTMEELAALPAIFKESGSVTAGNSCFNADGAAAALVMSEKRAETLGFEPLGHIRSYAFAGLEPERMGLGPSYAAPLALERAGLRMNDLDLIEINEAFAAQVLACGRRFEKLGISLDWDKVNVNGGAVALGHPVGMSPLRLAITVLKELKRREISLGLATMCVGGGLGGAMILERR
jgi:acetyl-CoA C-acetyltransferase